MIIPGVLLALVTIWGIISIITQKREDERERIREEKEVEKNKKIADLENQIKMMRGK